MSELTRTKLEKIAGEVMKENGCLTHDDLIGAVWKAAQIEECEECALAVEAESLCGPTDSEGDQAYDTAIEHAAKAIRMRSTAELRCAETIGGAVLGKED